MTEIFIRKGRRGSNRISKPKWININPKKFRIFQQGPDGRKTRVQYVVPPRRTIHAESETLQGARTDKKSKVCDFYSRTGVCKRFNSPCPYRHENSQEISPKSPTMVLDYSELIYFEPTKSEDVGPPPSKKFKPNETTKETSRAKQGRQWYPKQNVREMSNSDLYWY